MLSRAQRAGAAPLPPALPVPERLRDVYAGELGDLSPGAWRAAVLCAASSNQEAAPVLAALAAEGLDSGTCLAEAGEVLLAQGGVLTFRHPMLRSATWERASVSERLSAHARWPQSSRTGPLVPGTARRPRPATTQRWPASWRRSPMWTAHAVGSPPPRGPWNAPPGSLPTPCSEVTGSPRRRRTPTSPVTPTALDGWRPRCSDSDVGADPRARVLLALGLLEWSHGPFARARELFEQAAHLATGRLLVRTLCELFHTCHLLDDTRRHDRGCRPGGAGCRPDRPGAGHVGGVPAGRGARRRGAPGSRRPAAAPGDRAARVGPGPP